MTLQAWTQKVIVGGSMRNAGGAEFPKSYINHNDFVCLFVCLFRID